MKRLVIIDGKSVFYRGYYAMGALSTSEGVPTGGIYGFAAIAMEIVRKLKPTKVVVAWDSKTSTKKRKEIFSDYKAGRKKPDEDFYAQIPYLKELVLALGWSFVECEEYEADDIIGTLALQADELSAERILSSDRASRQPAVAGASRPTLSAVASESSSDNIRSADSHPPEVLGNSNVFLGDDVAHEQKEDDSEGWETYIVSSDLDMLQIVDENTRMYRILKGFSKLEELDVAAVEAKYGIEKRQFLDLKALKGDTSDNIPGVPGVGEKTAVKLLNDYRSLAGIYEHLDEIKGATRKKLEEGRESAEMSYKLAKIMTTAPVKLEDLPDFEIDEGRILAALDKLEFRSLARRFFPKNGVGIMGKDEQNRVFGAQEVLGGVKDGESRGTAGQKERRENGGADSPKRQKKAASADVASFGQQTLEVVQETEDGVLVSWNVKDLMHKNEKVAEKVLQGQKYWDLGQGAFLLNPLGREFEHGEEMVEYNRQRWEFEQRQDLYTVYKDFDLPLIPILYKMEVRGMLIDKEYFAGLKREFGAEVRALEAKIWKMAGKEFNVNSPAQLAEVLFKDLALPTKGIKKTARGYSTGVKELDKLQPLHPIIGLIKEYREAAKLLTTYIEPLPELADAQGRIHTTFNQNVTATGRLSSTAPNLQNIPVRTEVGKRIREGFIAAPGKVLVSADYSQFELRLAAALAGDWDLVRDFNEGVDIHTKTAAEAFGVPMSEVTKQQRRAAKVINFGILYGMSVKGLADAADMNLTEAKEFIDHYFELRKPIKEYLNKVLVQARERGYVETFFGRRRPTPDVLSANFIVRTGAERAAQNMPIQGTEADLMKRAMIRLDKKLEAELPGVGMVVQVHDSLIVECEEGDAKAVGGLLKKEMEGVAPELPVRLAVEVTVGNNWGEL